MSTSRGTAEQRLEPDEWVRVMEQAHELGCRSLQFIGGEPLLMGDRLLDLADRAREIGFAKQAVFTSLSFLEERWIDRMVELDMQVACSIYSKRPEIHDLVTTKKGSFERTIGNVHRLKERGIQPRFAVTVMKHNQDVVEETMQFLRDLGMEHPGFDLVRPSGRGNDAELVPDKLAGKRAYRTRAEFLQTDRETFMRRLGGNSCWQGKIAVSSIGDVHPCIMQRDDPAGNVRTEPLASIIAGGIRRYWDLSLDAIEVCRDCEYRYACHDCRPVAYGPTGSLTAKSLYCSYDPYQGEWIDRDLVTLSWPTAAARPARDGEAAP
jgi:radical SAM protein with 4Fe4S-binding SPASM domain